MRLNSDFCENDRSKNKHKYGYRKITAKFDAVTEKLFF